MQLPKLPALPPHHLVDDARVGLDDLHDLGGHVLVGVVGNGRLGKLALGVRREGAAVTRKQLHSHDVDESRQMSKIGERMHRLACPLFKPFDHPSRIARYDNIGIDVLSNN